MGKSAPHFHRTHAIGVSQSGGGTLFAMGKAWRHGVGMVVVTNPFETHWGRPSPEGLDYCLFYPRPAWLQTLASVTRHPAGVHFGMPVIEDKALALRLALAFEAVADQRSERLLRQAVDQLLSKHAVAVPEGLESTPRGAGVPLPEAATGSEPSIAGLAADAGLSRSYYSRDYRKRVGLSPRDHRRQRRVLAARSLIEAGTSLAEAAAGAGFADQAHMTRQFRQILGTTPAAYRR
jgi:AraC-like DNA-binding protein